MRGLRHPPLGLVLMLAAMYTLPGYASLFVQMVHMGGSLTDELGLVVLLQVVTVVLQFATGVAVARQRYAEITFGAYCVSAIAMAVAAVRVVDENVGASLAIAIETLAWPIVILVAPVAFRLERLSNERGAGEVAAVLFALGIGGLLSTGFAVADLVKTLRHAHMSIGSWLGMMINPAESIVISVLAIWAGLRLRRVRLLAYLIVAIALRTAMTVVGTISLAVYGGLGDHAGLIHATRLVGLGLSYVAPIALWCYARGRVDGENAPVAQVLGWTLLGFVPILLSRVFIGGELKDALGTGVGTAVMLMCAVLGLAMLAAGAAILRETDAAGVVAAVAALIAGVLVGSALYATLRETDSFRHTKPIGALGILVATPAAAAWIHRRRQK